MYSEIETLTEALELMLEKLACMNKMPGYTRADKANMKKFVASMRMMLGSAKAQAGCK